MSIRYKMGLHSKYTLYIAIVLVIAVLYFYPISIYWTSAENMASLDEGTFANNYPAGTCTNASLARCACTVGNCPTGTLLTGDKYCDIQCAQISDKKMQEDCKAACIKTISECNEEVSQCEGEPAPAQF